MWLSFWKSKTHSSCSNVTQNFSSKYSLHSNNRYKNRRGINLSYLLITECLEKRTGVGDALAVR